MMIHVGVDSKTDDTMITRQSASCWCQKSCVCALLWHLGKHALKKQTVFMKFLGNVCKVTHVEGCFKIDWLKKITTLQQI